MKLTIQYQADQRYWENNQHNTRFDDRFFWSSITSIIAVGSLTLSPNSTVAGQDVNYTYKKPNVPLYNVDVEAYATPFLIDFDGDGDFDVFVGSDNGTAKYYKNTGSNTNPVFAEQTGGNNPLTGFDIGDNSTPSFVDIDGDGDMEAFMGAKDGTIHHYWNLGTAATPNFTEIIGVQNPLDGVDVGGHSTPHFTDIDDDGDFDVFIGSKDGGISFFENNGVNAPPVFTEKIGADNPVNGLIHPFDCLYQAPYFADFDDDGDLDGFVGCGSTIKYLKNNGTKNNPSFTLASGTADPFTGLEFGSRPAPSVVDYNGDGDFDVFSGQEHGNVAALQNTGSSLTGSLEVWKDSKAVLSNVDVGLWSDPDLVDIDNDGDLDAFIGDYGGKIFFYKNIGSASAANFVHQTGSDNPFDGASFGDLPSLRLVDIDGDGDHDAFIGQSDGIIEYYKNTGTVQVAVFTQQNGAANPFDGVDVGAYSRPSFVDIDNDGDLDAFISEVSGSTLYYFNMGTRLSPTFILVNGVLNPLNGVDGGFLPYPRFSDIDGDGDFDAVISSYVAGEIKYLKNTGTKVSASFTQQSGENNPFNAIGSFYDANVCFADINSDNEPDVFTGGYGGKIRFYERDNNFHWPLFLPAVMKK